MLRSIAEALRPRSILHLVLVGFAAVTLPLLVGLGVVVVQVDGLARTSQVAGREAAETVQLALTLADRVAGMERGARRYEALGDAASLGVYVRGRKRFLSTLSALRGLGPDRVPAALLDRLAAKERSIFAAVSAHPREPVAAGDAGAGFRVLSGIVREVIAQDVGRLARETRDMRRAAGDAWRLILWTLAGLLPLTVALGVVFTILITRPLRRLDLAIHRLGAGELATEVDVRGPRDLQDLGHRLDWMRRRLAELEMQKIAFLRHVSHELKTPLTTIREGAELLHEETDDPRGDEHAEIVSVLRSSARELQRLIEGLLQYSVRPTPLTASEVRPVTLDTLIERCLDEHSVSLRTRHLRVERDLDPLIVYGDPEQLRIVLDNLLSNAIKYSPTSGVVKIELQARTGCAVLDIEDEGPGIPAEERERVFEAFYQGSIRHRGPVRGTGLGLSIAREFVNAHNGAVEIVDTARGAHLRVTLPLTPSRAP